MSESAIQLEVRRPGREPSVFDIPEGVYTVGSDEDCRIRLQHESVESRHAILTVRSGESSIEDLFSPTGTQIGSQKVDGRASVLPGQEVHIGPFVLVLHMAGSPQPVPVQEPVVPIAPPSPQNPAPVPGPTSTQTDSTAPSMPADPSPAPAHDAELRRSIKQQIHRELVERMDVKRLASSHVKQEDLEKKAMATIRKIVEDVSTRLPNDVDPEKLIKEVYDEALGLGPLVAFLDDPSVTEVMVNGHENVFVERNGKLQCTGQTFMDDSSVLAVIERIVSPIGRRIDESQPYVDARLADGSRVNAIIPPLSLVGPCLTIRKFSKKPFTDADLIRFGTMPPQFCEFAKICVLLRKNIIVSGGTGSGKTSLLNVLSSYLPATDRILTIEDAAELRLQQPHVVRLEARPPNIEGRGAITIRDLVRNALRMRPDRIVVGECRGGEALDMLQAMNTGHDGSLTTVHVNSPRDVISRLETMVLMSGMDLPVRAIREQVAAAVDCVIHESRFSDGSRKVTRITEICGLEGDQITMQDIFEFQQTGVDAEGKIVGRFRATGAVPTFVDDVLSRGLHIDRAIFDPKTWEN